MKHILFYILCFFFCAASPAFAATSITIQETQSLTFPTIGLPSAGTTNLTISPLNSSTSGTATILSGTASRGTYTLTAKGKGGISISIDITGITTGNAGLTLSAFRGFYRSQTISSFPSSTLPLPAVSPGTPLYLGATVTADSTVPAGSYTGSFDITVFVQ
ncbi:MAG TPA: hypothetical protein DCY07_08930 [Rhodospirillaceae bacterium]|nr:hypothetical protein [Rhodospirillaceae bacterium]